MTIFRPLDGGIVLMLFELLEKEVWRNKPADELSQLYVKWRMISDGICYSKGLLQANENTSIEIDMHEFWLWNGNDNYQIETKN